MPTEHIPVIFVDTEDTKMAVVGSLEHLQVIMGAAASFYSSYIGTTHQITLRGLPVRVKKDIEKYVALAAMEIPGYEAMVFYREVVDDPRTLTRKDARGQTVEYL